MSLISRIFTGGNEARSFTPSNWGIPTPAQDHAMQTAAIPEGNPMALGAFYACVTLLADVVSTLGVNAYRWKNGAKVLVDPQPTLLANAPYPETTWFSWLWMMMESLAVTGNAFGYVTQFDKAGFPTGILPIHPDMISVQIPADPMKWADPEYYINGKRTPSNKIIHIKRYPVAGKALGMSPVQKAAAAVGLGLAAERYGLRYFRDSANPSGILSTEQELTPDQQKRAMKSWILSHQGRRLPAVMSGGLQWQPITLTPNESQFLETRSFQRSEIAMWFRVPPFMIGDTEKSSSWGTGIEEMTLGFHKYTLGPWLTCIEQMISALLPRGQFAKFNVDELLRTDAKRRWETYRIGRDAGVYSVNDILDMEDREPIGPEGDVRLQPANFVPLGTTPEDMAAAKVAATPSTPAEPARNRREIEDDSP